MSPRNTPHSSRGFTLIELLVSMAIISIITGIVLFQYRSFNTSSLLTNQAYEIALDTRHAQVFALGERIDGADPRDEWGVVFKPLAPDIYTIFRDTLDNNKLDAPGEIIDEKSLDNRFEIASLRVKVGANEKEVIPLPGSYLAILFKRPNYDAIFNTSASGITKPIDEVSIVIQSTDDPTAQREITVTATGQITVSTP